MDRDELIGVIVAAFDGISQPQDITLHVAEAHHTYDYEHDNEHREKDWIGRWQDIPDEHLMACEHALDHVDKVGMHFYLPAYMVWYLSNYEDRHRTWIESAKYPMGLHPPDEALSSYQVERYSLFSDEQLRACELFGALWEELDRKELINIITDAFDGVERPERITLHVAQAHDDYDYTHDHQHGEFDQFDRWQDIPDEDLLECPDALSYFDKFGMRFYLPAYMVFFLRHFGEHIFEWSNPHSVLYTHDNHPNDEKLAAYHRERFSLFSPQQLHACSLFVTFCADDRSKFSDVSFAKKIYEEYWKQYDRRSSHSRSD